jgi:DNA-binding NarL/FixJ family response regulator
VTTADAHRIRVLIVDDHALYRRGLLTVLATEGGIEVVGEAADGVEAVMRAEESLPDVIVMDVGMPKRGGIEACRAIKQQVPSARILMLTSSDDGDDLFEAIRAGANGYLLKDMPPEEVAVGIRRVFDGQSLLSPLMASKLLTEFAQISRTGTPAPTDQHGGHPGHPGQAGHPGYPSHPGQQPTKLALPRLTERELGILRLVARGRLNREIATELFISENTVRNHIRNILDKLQMHSRVEAAMYAVRQRLIEPGD